MVNGFGFGGQNAVAIFRRVVGLTARPVAGDDSAPVRATGWTAPPGPVYGSGHRSQDRQTRRIAEMTAKPTAADQPFTVVLDDDETTVAEGRLRDIDAGPTWAKHRVRISLDDATTRAATRSTRTTVAITLRFDDDVEGHALSLHFPSRREGRASSASGSSPPASSPARSSSA